MLRIPVHPLLISGGNRIQWKKGERKSRKSWKSFAVIAVVVVGVGVGVLVVGGSVVFVVVVVALTVVNTRDLESIRGCASPSVRPSVHNIFCFWSTALQNGHSL